MNPTRSRTIVSAIATLCLGTVMASPALGALSASPNPSTGSYTVSGSVSTSATFHFFQLHETGPGNTTATYTVSDISDISESFSDKATGTYTYQVQGCRTYPRPGLLPRCTDIGDSLTVTVSSPPADPMPDFGEATVSAKSWKQNSSISSFTVPAASGGDTPLSYSATGLPTGVSMNASRSVSGTPTGHGTGTAKVTVTDDDGDTASLSFDWTVGEDLAPDFGDATVSYRSWAQNSPIPAFTVPAASGGDTPLSYSISGLPAGLSMSSSREISGTPTASGAGTATVTVTDDDGDTDTLRFGWYVGVDREPTFGTASISNKTFKQNSAISAFYVPIASNGNWPLSYSATGLPAGVSLASNRRVSGTPTAHGMGTATVTVTDNDGDTDTLDFDWTVNEDLAPSFGTASVADKDWTLRTSIAAFTVPAASGGDGTLRYSVSGLPSSVWMSTSTRRVSGRPLGNDADSGTATVTVRDDDGDTDTLSFDWTVEDPMPDFGEATVTDKTWMQNSSVARFTVPAASGGNSPRRYSATGLPDGVAMSSLRRVSGTPTAAGTGTATVTVTDYDGDTDTLTFDWTVNEDLAPSFGTASVADKDWTLRTSIAAFTVPAASGGDGTLRYSVSGLPSSVWMSTSTRRVSGRPLGNDADSGTATVTVRDADGDTVTLTFDWSVADPMPDFGEATVPDKTWSQDIAISSFTVPAASGGNSPRRYTASGLPDGVRMSSTRRVSGTPEQAGSGTATVTVRDYDGDTDTLSFDWTVDEDLMPSFGTASVADKDWTLRTSIAAFTVPAASGGDGTLSYSVSGLPPGVSMASSTRRVSGSPTGSDASTGTATVTVRDDDGDTDTLTFDWSVADPMPEFGEASVPDKSWEQNSAVTTFTVPAASGGNSPLSYTATGLPDGVRMSSTRRVSGTPTKAGSGTATVTVRDNDGDTDTLSFDWTVAAEDRMPIFDVDVSEQYWVTGSALQALTVPAARGGDAPLSYTASGLPDGVSMSSSRSISGTPTAAGSGTATITVTDADDDTDSFSFDWTTYNPLRLSDIASKSWTQNQAIAAFGAAASGGVAPLTHSVSGLPAGVTASSSGSVSGTPTGTGSGTATVSVTDAIGNTGSESFTWSVTAEQTDKTPSFGTVTVPAKSWTQNRAITAFTVPAATGGNGTLTYSATGLPAGVTMSSSRAVSGTPTEAGSGTATVTATDNRGHTDTLTFDWTVADPDRLTKGFDEHYTAHTGFLNSDARTDIYLKHTPDLVFIPVNDKLVPVAPDQADVGDFVLMQNADGTFEIEALTPAQKTIVSGWSAASGIRLDLGDFNLDNVHDIFMSGVSGALTSPQDRNVLDQVIFASPDTGARPVHVAAMTQDRRRFFSDAYKWSRDHDYFDDNAPVQQTSRVVDTHIWIPRLCRPLIDQLTPLRRSTISGSVGQTLPEILAEFDIFIADCGVHQYDFISYEFASVRYTINAESKDYTVFHRGALAFADIMTDVIANGGLIAQSKEAQSLEQLFKIIWGIDTFMGGILSQGGTVQGEPNVPADRRSKSRIRVIDGLILQVDYFNETDRPEASFSQCYMRAWGLIPISKERHYARNENQENPWQSIEDFPRKFFENYGETATHNIGTSGNEDWRGIIPPYYRWQLIYDSNGTLVSDAVNLGTYDYASPIFSFQSHILLDITPWIEWGNSDLDMSTRTQRLEALFRSVEGWIGIAGYIRDLYGCLYRSQN